MSDLVLKVCCSSIKDKYGDISEEQLVELVRERISFGRRRNSEV